MSYTPIAYTPHSAQEDRHVSYPIPIISAETQRLAQRLSQASAGDIISYAELSILIERPIQSSGRSMLRTARKHVLIDHQLVFEPIRNVGLKCLTDADLAACGSAHLKRIHNASRTGLRKMSTVRIFSGLTPTEQLRHNTSMTLLATFFEVTRARNVTRVEQVVSQVGRVLPLAETLKVFGLT